MATTPRLPGSNTGERAAGGAATADRPSLRSVLSHDRPLRAAFDQMYGTLWTDGVAAVDVKEAMRLRNARVTGCGL